MRPRRPAHHVTERNMLAEEVAADRLACRLWRLADDALDPEVHRTRRESRMVKAGRPNSSSQTDRTS
jgi:hypothetical protein